MQAPTQTHRIEWKKVTGIKIKQFLPIKRTPEKLRKVFKKKAVTLPLVEKRSTTNDALPA